MLTMILSITFVVLLFGFTIFVHELGHFLVARWCGMTVDAFAIGMGQRPLSQRRRTEVTDGVSYRVARLDHVGGFVEADLGRLVAHGDNLVGALDQQEGFVVASE